MTAKMKHGHKAHPPAHGADPGSTHERLNRLHAKPGRPEGSMHAGGEMPPAPAGPPPAMGEGPSMPPPGGGMEDQSSGAGPSTDDDGGM